MGAGCVDQLGGYIRKEKKKGERGLEVMILMGLIISFVSAGLMDIRMGIDGATTMNEDENRPEQKTPYDKPCHPLTRSSDNLSLLSL